MRESEWMLAGSERRAAGRELRQRVARSDHGHWSPPPDRPDPLALLREQDRRRVPDLVSIRWGRMLHSPFTFLRGAAAVMARDLAATPVTGIHVQACGDAHLANFGLFGSPERRLLFDVNDFDETHRAPWEWDVKRLATSAVLAGRDAGLPEPVCIGAAEAAVRSYRHWTATFAGMEILDAWYTRVDAERATALFGRSARRAYEDAVRRARMHTSQAALPQLTTVTERGVRRIVDHPPLVTHQGIGAWRERLDVLLSGYRRSLRDDDRALLERFRVVDFARKVVGVGSVGTRCHIVLLQSADGEPLFLQVKEAQPSVLAPHVSGGARVRNQGRRVVEGQRLVQAASDIFLGWVRDGAVDYYVRQLYDMKGSFALLETHPRGLIEYLALCGWTLARAHARSGMAAEIAGYLGRGDAFDRAVAAFAVAYADQTVRDHAELVEAVHAGRIRARADC